MCTSLSDECVPLGCMMINSCARLCPLLQQVSLFALPNAPSLSDLDWEESDKDSGNPHWRTGSITTRVSPWWKKNVLLQSGTVDLLAPPHFDSRSRIFELDSCGGNGKVCLVYKNCTPGVLFPFLHFNFKKYAKPLSAFSTFRHVSSRCRSPEERSLVPRSLAVLAFPDVHFHLLLQTDDHKPRPARVAVRLHPVRAQPSGQGSTSEHSGLGESVGPSYMWLLYPWDVFTVTFC